MCKEEEMDMCKKYSGKYMIKYSLTESKKYAVEHV